MTDTPIRDSLPRTPIRGQASLPVRTMAPFCVRNTALENIHAGPAPATGTGDWSDVTVVDAEGQAPCHSPARSAPARALPIGGVRSHAGA